MPDVPFLPPGPSPEFLKRQAVMGLPQDPAFTGSFDPIRGNAFAGSFDPSTGVRQGMTVNAPVTPPATSEMQMLEAIRQQVNAMHFKNAQDALNASIQFQHMREAQRMRERGATEEQIMSRLGRGLFYQNNNPYAQARAVSEMGPVMAPTVTESGGVKILRYGKGGTQARVVPQSAIPQPEFKSRVFKVDGHEVVQLGPTRYQYLGKENEGKAVPPSVLERIYTHEISDAKEELDELPDNDKPETVAKRTELQRQIAESRAKRRSVANPTAPTPQNAPATPTTKEQYDALPSGSFYIDPSTKRLKRKK